MRAEELEKKGAFAQAAVAFRDFARADPENRRAGEALYRAGVDMGWRLGVCAEARPMWEDSARTGQMPWSGMAKLALVNCPDYFPVMPGTTWTYVDTQTGGANMREVVRAREKVGGTVLLSREMYAGHNLYEAREQPVVKSGWEIREGPAVMLRFPFVKGAHWEAKQGKATFLCTVAETDAKARTRTGSYRDCLKLKVQVAGINTAWKYDYYCPGIGRVMTTVAGPGFERPNTELSEFHRP